MFFSCWGLNLALSYTPDCDNLFLARWHELSTKIFLSVVTPQAPFCFPWATCYQVSESLLETESTYMDTYTSITAIVTCSLLTLQPGFPINFSMNSFWYLRLLSQPTAFPVGSCSGIFSGLTLFFSKRLFLWLSPGLSSKLTVFFILVFILLCKLSYCKTGFLVYSSENYI